MHPAQSLERYKAKTKQNKNPWQNGNGQIHNHNGDLYISLLDIDEVENYKVVYLEKILITYSWVAVVYRA